MVYSGVMPASRTATQEGTMTLSAITTAPASRPGAVSGYECKCSCGLVMRSSLLTALHIDAAAHVAYHEKRGK